jgi:hypothetical protein
VVETNYASVPDAGGTGGNSVIYVESPSSLIGVGTLPKVFLGGGITGCQDWQREVVGMLRDVEAVVYNPRRAEWDMSDPNASDEQIKWEVLRLHEADLISFWFPAATLCPITLYELGAWSATRRPRRKPLVVGCEPGYARELDVRIQTKYARPDVEVVDSLEALVAGIKGRLCSSS